MKDHASKLRNIFLPALCVLCFAVCLLCGVPELPSYKAIISMNEDVIQFILQNLYAVLYFCFSLIFGGISIYFTARLGKQAENNQMLFKSGIIFGIFILDSGIWILTDSEFFKIFSEYININTVVLVSFISFMLMPILFLKCVNVRNRKFCSAMEGLLEANTALLLCLAIFRAKQVYYLIPLALHHIMIIGIAVYFIFICIKDAAARQSAIGVYTVVVAIIFYLLVILSIAAFVFGCVNYYSITIAVALVILIIEVSRLIINKMVRIYGRKVETEFYRRLACMDIMSGVYNRNAFDIDRYSFSDSDNLCFVILDINKLKNVNDSIGHDAGDGIIAAAGKISRECLSPLGKCYRIGGDEFAVICTDVKEKEVNAAMKILEEKLDEYNRIHTPKLSIAYGYALRKSVEMTVDELFEQADKNMYAHKKAEIAAFEKQE